MKKVWVYGCSFSLLFQDNEDVPAMTLSDSWPNIVASKTGYVLKERSESAAGWGTIRGAIERDIIDNVISKDDIMIISPSFFGRSTSPYFEETLHLYAQYGINPDEAACLNVNGFCSTIKLLREAGYKAYGWCWSRDGVVYKRGIKWLESIEHLLIKAPNGSLYFEDWIFEDPNRMYVPGKKLGESQWTGDSHFGKQGHKEMAEHLIKTITWE